MRPRSLRARAVSFFICSSLRTRRIFAENRVLEWCILQKNHTGHENNLWLDLRCFLQDCLVGLPRKSLPTFTEFGLWEVPKRQNYHTQIVNPAFEPHRPVRFGSGVNLRFVNLCTFLKMTQCLFRGRKGDLVSPDHLFDVLTSDGKGQGYEFELFV